MKYIIMAGGYYPRFETPRQLLKFMGEPLVARTIRLLHENQITDVAISTNIEGFDHFGVPVLHHENNYVGRAYNDADGYWCECFYPMDEPACYIFGDVVFSEAAIRKIVETETDDIMFFGSAPPYPPEYVKPYEEPFAFKVMNQEHLHQAIADVKRLTSEGRFFREPIAWEMWNVISKGADGDINHIDYNSYARINDWTCDIDSPDEIKLLEVMAQRSQW